MTQRCRRVDRREHLAPRRLDVALEPVERMLGLGERRLLGPQGAADLVPLDAAPFRVDPVAVELALGRVPPGLQVLELALHLGQRVAQHLDLLGVERDLLLPAFHRELARVRRIPGTCGAALGLCELDLTPLAFALDQG